MRIKFLLIFTCFLIVGCASRYDDRLIGSWKSDREKTVAEYCRRFPSRFENNPEKKEKFSKMFGHMVHTYTPTEITIGFDADTCTTIVKYRVVKKANNFVVIEIDQGEWTEERKLTFENDLQSYWLDESWWQVSENFNKTSLGSGLQDCYFKVQFHHGT